MKKNLLKHRPQGKIIAPVFSAANKPKLLKAFALSCLFALLISLTSVYFDTQNSLHKSCTSVADDFTAIMQSYQHSFCLFEIILQREIHHTQDADQIEAFLKGQDQGLLKIEGEDFDGVYMYYRERYLYSWATPQSVYENSGYDATKRPWYIGAMEAKGDIFFSVPYPSYANDYMLATISRLQPDQETVIAYDIKLGEIKKYVDKLDLYNGALTLICDTEGNIIGSTEPLYSGGNYQLSAQQLEERIEQAEQELATATDENNRLKAAGKVESAKALQEFCQDQQGYLRKLCDNKEELQFNLAKLTFGFAYCNGQYTCFVLAPISKLLTGLATLWAALSFVLILAAILILALLWRNSQVLSDALTGLNNRRALYKYCHHHITHHPQEDLYLLMIDLNNFKQVNDQFGHLAGDHALQDTAQALKQVCDEVPSNLFLCRYGGDEFLLAGTFRNPNEIVQITELINQHLQEKNETGYNPYILEASIGVAKGKCISTADLEYLLHLADKNMYKEKMRMKQM